MRTGSQRAAITGVVLAILACSDGQGPDYPDVAGTWLLTAEWEREAYTWVVGATLTLVQDGVRFDGSFTDASGDCTYRDPPTFGDPPIFDQPTVTCVAWVQAAGTVGDVRDGVVTGIGTVRLCLLGFCATGAVRGDSMSGIVVDDDPPGSWFAVRR